MDNNFKKMDNYIIYTDHIIGKGSFGTVYLAHDKKNKQLVGVKIESKKDTTLLLREYNLIKFIHAQEGCKNNIIKHHLLLNDNNSYYMFMDLYGPNLDCLHKQHNRQFDVDMLNSIIVQMSNAIKFCHKIGIVHRDIKPANFMTRFCAPHTNIYLCDFGLAKKYICKGEHIPYKTNVARVGSLRYMSKFTHRSIQVSCRDDMYSLVYVIIFLATGDLPWSNNEIINKDKSQKHNVLYCLKTNTTNKNLCKDIKNSILHSKLIEFLTHLDTLEFKDKINYDIIYML
uniref:non-specific serine/threonine protein kinase n=1 Tax=viral metagenome TaxID=1070528 RepID=A0A6C0JAY2_9ZZZZ